MPAFEIVSSALSSLTTKGEGNRTQAEGTWLWVERKMKNLRLFRMIAGIRARFTLLWSCFVLFSFVFPAQASAKDRFQLVFVEQADQESGWLNGSQFIDDADSASKVRLVNVHDQLPDKQSTFRVIVLNSGGEPITIGHDDVWIEYAKGERVAMESYEELQGRFRRDIKRRQALAGLGAALSAGSANGYTSGTFDYSGSTMYGTQFRGTGTYTAYDPALARLQQAQAREQADATFRSIETRQLRGMDALNGLLRRTTLQPGQVHSSVVAFDPPRSLRKLPEGATITVVVKVGANHHRITAFLSEL